MKVISIPTRLRLAMAFLFLCVPFAALETVIVTRAPWWRMPYRSMAVWSASVALICTPLAAWLIQGKKWALQLTTAFAMIWVSLSVWTAIRLRMPSLGFLSIGLLIYFSVLIRWLTREERRSFFDPQMNWFQGLPKPIPGLLCDLSLGDHPFLLKVSRLDREGVFLFLDEGHSTLNDSSSLKAGVPVELTFSFRSSRIQCSGVPIGVLRKGTGASFKFQSLRPDIKKELGDFIGVLEGEGYV